MLADPCTVTHHQEKTVGFGLSSCLLRGHTTRLTQGKIILCKAAPAHPGGDGHGRLRVFIPGPLCQATADQGT